MLELHQRTQNSAEGSTMNIQKFSKKNCHYEKVRFVLTWHNFHYDYFHFNICLNMNTSIGNAPCLFTIHFQSQKSYALTIAICSHHAMPIAISKSIHAYTICINIIT